MKTARRPLRAVPALASAGPRALRRPAFAVALALLLGGCAGDGGARPDDARTGGRAQQCKAGDTRIADESDCLQDDAACYALAGGDWCTGERGNTCPAGSSALPDGAPCPPGARCITLGESLECAITVR